MICELPYVQAESEKVEEPEIKLPISIGPSKKQESFKKPSTSALLTLPNPLTVWITTNSGKFFKRWEYQTNWPASWEICMQVKKYNRMGHGRADWFQIGKGVCQGHIISPCLFMCRVHHMKCWAGWSTRWNQVCQEKYQEPQVFRWHCPYGWR